MWSARGRGETARAPHAGRIYGVYIYHMEQKEKGEDRKTDVIAPGEHRVTLKLELPTGNYTASWIDPQTGDQRGKEKFAQTSGARVLKSPAHTADIALVITANR